MNECFATIRESSWNTSDFALSQPFQRRGTLLWQQSTQLGLSEQDARNKTARESHGCYFQVVVEADFSSTWADT